MFWWEEEALLTEKDRAAIAKAKTQYWAEIDENTAETETGRRRIHDIVRREALREEYAAGL